MFALCIKTFAERRMKHLKKGVFQYFGNIAVRDKIMTITIFKIKKKIKIANYRVFKIYEKNQ